MKNLPPNASKIEEINFIKELAKELPVGSYLSQLLNPRLVEWVEQNIRKDYACDIIGEFEQSQRVLTEQTDRADDAEEALAKAMERIKAMVPVAVLTDCEAARNEFQRQAQSNEERAIKYSNDLTAAENKITELAGRVGRRDHEILHLKAQIYDLSDLLGSMFAATIGKSTEDGIETFIKEQIAKMRKNG